MTRVSGNLAIDLSALHVALWFACPIVASAQGGSTPGRAEASPVANECATPPVGWLWCDDFEQDRLGKYFEYENANGRFERVAGVGVRGSFGMRARFTKGETSAGALHLAFGKVPSPYFRPVDGGSTVYRDLYWRLYVRYQPGWIGGVGYKLTRAMSFVSVDWAEAMVAHLWGGDPPDTNYLQLDPVSGTDATGRVRPTRYNDFVHFRWLGRRRGTTPLADAEHAGQWYCVETHVQLNEPGRSNGLFEFWVNGDLQARETELNFVGSFTAYGLNAVFFENYWNDGAPRVQERYLDNIVVSTQRIGC